MNNDTDGQYGGQGMSPWTRLNMLEPNQVFDFNNQPPYLPDDSKIGSDAMIVKMTDALFVQFSD